MAPLTQFLLETLGTLLVVSGIAFVVLRAGRKLGLGGASTGPIELVARLSLEPRRSIYVVKVLDRLFVLGGSEAGITAIGELGSSELPKLRPDAIDGMGFSDVLARAMGRASSSSRSELQNSNAGNERGAPSPTATPVGASSSGAEPPVESR